MESKINCLHSLTRECPAYIVVACPWPFCLIYCNLFISVHIYKRDLMHHRFRGVVGYHVSLTHWRSPVRVRAKTTDFFYFFCIELSLLVHVHALKKNMTMIKVVTFCRCIIKIGTAEHVSFLDKITSVLTSISQSSCIATFFYISYNYPLF